MSGFQGSMDDQSSAQVARVKNGTRREEEPTQEREVRVEELAYSKGYRVMGGNVYSQFGARKLNPAKTKGGYLCFTVLQGSRTNKTRKSIKCFVHRLVAFQKYGSLLYTAGIEVRHRDGKRINNREGNILIGSHKQNMLDIAPHQRLAKSLTAAAHRRILSDTEVEKIRGRRLEGASYSQLVSEFNLSGKGQAHYIINNEYKTHKY